MTRRQLGRLICALGVAQIISWGSLFYSIAVLGESMRADLGVSGTWLFGAFTAGLVCSGLVSPLVGRTIDTRGGWLVLSAGSLIAALSLLVLSQAEGIPALFVGWGLAGVAMAACLYDPAFATLHQLTGKAYRRSVTALTLFGGFASTVFWPLSQFLLDRVGWRVTFELYALLHVIVCLPLHAWLVARPTVIDALSPGAEEGTADIAQRAGRTSFVLLAIALSIASFVAAGLSAHLIVLFRSSGIEAQTAVWIASLIGPMQVAGRIVELVFSRQLRPLAVGSLAFGLMALAMLLLNMVDRFGGLAWLFAAVYGWSNGILTIVRGTVPAELFGRKGYGALLGRLALPSFVCKAFAPLAVSLVLVGAQERSLGLYAMLGLAFAAVLAYQLALALRTRA